MTDIVFGCRREYRLLETLILAQALRKLDSVDFTCFLILSPTAACDIAANDAFDVDSLRFSGNHDPVLQ